nr:T9SS type A sorting domain-containing protein [Bacteroidota bacterium]
VDIVNPQGKTLSSTQFNTLSAQVGMARLSPGIYFVKVYTNSGVHIQKVCNF